VPFEVDFAQRRIARSTTDTMSDLPPPEYYENIDWDEQVAEDERLIARVTAHAPGDENPLLDLSRPLDLGEKADDAMD